MPEAYSAKKIMSRDKRGGVARAKAWKVLQITVRSLGFCRQNDGDE